MSQEFESRFPIIVEQAVQWGEMDAFQHVNNVTYFTYFENARLAYFEESGINKHMAETQIGPILASTKCDFKAPLTYPDTIKIGSKIRELAEKRITMHYAVWSTNLQCIVAEGEGLIVYFDYNSGKSTQVPQRIIDQIQSLQKLPD